MYQMIHYILLLKFNIPNRVINLANIFLKPFTPLALPLHLISHFSQSADQPINFQILFKFSPWYLWSYFLFQIVRIFIIFINTSLSILGYLVNFIFDYLSNIIINVFLMAWNWVAKFFLNFLNLVPSSYFWGFCFFMIRQRDTEYW